MSYDPANIHHDVFLDTPIGWGSKYPRETRLCVIWEQDREYLLWAANLKADRPNRHPLPSYQLSLIRFIHELHTADARVRDERLAALREWRLLAREGEGLSSLPRPSPADCRNIISRATLVGAHSDLDGIYSAAAAIGAGGALDRGKAPGAFHRIRLFRYGFRGIAEYTEALFGEFAGDNEPCVIVIDFAAHPDATLNLDHHTTALCYWEFSILLPQGVYDPAFPSCPRLLADCCGLSIPEAVLTGCDLVDGARYANVEQTIDFTNPFVALEFALQVDVSELVAKKAVLTLADADLDPHCLLSQPVWKARVDLVRLELEEQRTYWQKRSRFKIFENLLAVADARLAPYSPSRFRYLPFEDDSVRATPYLLTIRPKNMSSLNLGISRNPFYADRGLFQREPRNLGALAKGIGDGGGRIEAAAVTIEHEALQGAIDKALVFLMGEPTS